MTLMQTILLHSLLHVLQWVHSVVVHAVSLLVLPGREAIALKIEGRPWQSRYLKALRRLGGQCSCLLFLSSDFITAVEKVSTSQYSGEQDQILQNKGSV
jgi:hypothetical protein